MTHRIVPMLLLTLLAPVRADAAEHPGVIESEFIFEKMPVASCHASTIEQARDGTLVAAWFAGTHEKHPDVGIWISRRVDGKWSEPTELVNGVQYTNPDGSVHRHPCWNPVLFQPKDGPLMLFYKVGPDPRSWWGILMTSDDAGATWSTPRRLPEGIVGPIKNKPVQLADGSILAGASTEDGGWRLHMERTTDGGVTWHRTEPLNSGKPIAAIQPSILKVGGDRLVAVGRTRQSRVFRIASDDGGRTWGEMALTDLPNPNSGTDAVTLRDGRQLLVYNHSSRSRTPLNVALTEDAKTWQAALVLESEPGKFSYPAVIQTSDGLVHIVYTWQRQRIKHVVLDPAKLSLQPMPHGNWPG